MNMSSPAGMVPPEETSMPVENVGPGVSETRQKRRPLTQTEAPARVA
jgi:hypothetical protein